MKPQYKELENWIAATNELAIAFIERYYVSDCPIEDIDWYWVAQDIGGCLNVNDEFWDMNDIVNAFKYNAPKKKLFEWYYYCLDMAEKNESPINLKNYVR